MLSQLIHSRRRSFSSGGVLLMILIAFFSCTKERGSETTPNFSKLNIEVKSLKLSPVLFNIKMDDFTFEDSAANLGKYTNVVERTEAPQRLKITEIYSNTILLDSLITVPAGESLYTIYQIDTAAGAKPLFIVGSEKSDLPVDTFMQAFYVNDPVFPETFDILVYKIVDFAYAEMPPAHIYKNVKRGEFTAFLPFYMGGYYMCEVRKPNGELIKDMLPIDPQNALGGGGIYENRCDYSRNNHQVMKITATDTGGGTLFYALECMFMY